MHGLAETGDRDRGPGTGRRAATSGEADDGAGAGEHLGLAGPGGQRQYHLVAFELLLDLAADLYRGAGVVVGHDHRRGEPHPELDQGRLIAGPVRDVPAGLRHREHAVRDHVRQPHRLGYPLVPVDHVEVAGCAAVLDQAEPGRPVTGRRQLGARLHVGELDLLAHGSHPVSSLADATRGGRPSAANWPAAITPGRRYAAPPRSTMVECAVQTCSPPTVRISVLVVSNTLRPASLMSVIVACAVTTSSATIWREYSNRCSPCTTIA